MTVQDRNRWDARYRSARQTPLPDPDPLLFQFTPPPSTFSGEARALDLAGGFGQNALWLAEQGYSVDLLDISREALRRAQQAASERKLRRVNFLQVDLDETALRSEAYDLVCVFRFLNRDLFPRIRECVRRGGRILYQTYTVGALEKLPDMNPAYVLEPGELAGVFADWEILKSAELPTMSQLVAVKP
jgi:SAM-dependent methyltransferase